MVFFWKLFWPIVGENCFSDQEKHLKIEADKQKYVKYMKSLEQFIEMVKGLDNFGNRILSILAVEVEIWQIEKI